MLIYHKHSPKKEQTPRENTTTTYVRSRMHCCQSIWFALYLAYLHQLTTGETAHSVVFHLVFLVVCSWVLKKLEAYTYVCTYSTATHDILEYLKCTREPFFSLTWWSICFSPVPQYSSTRVSRPLFCLEYITGDQKNDEWVESLSSNDGRRECCIFQHRYHYQACWDVAQMSYGPSYCTSATFLHTQPLPGCVVFLKNPKTRMFLTPVGLQSRLGDKPVKF